MNTIPAIELLYMIFGTLFTTIFGLMFIGVLIFGGEMKFTSEGMIPKIIRHYKRKKGGGAE